MAAVLLVAGALAAIGTATGASRPTPAADGTNVAQAPAGGATAAVTGAVTAVPGATSTAAPSGRVTPLASIAASQDLQSSSASQTPGATPVPSMPAASSAPAPLPGLDPPPAPGPFQIDLYHRGDFVSELTKVMCVPAAMQTIVNIIEPGADRSAALQKRLYSRARELSTDALVGAGAEPEGWARALTELGYGNYAVDVRPSLSTAIRSAAIALRTTGRPVGLLVWRGAHSWVVSGFTATADPAWTTDFEVTGLYIEDVWYPRVSTIWGASRPPDALVPVGKMGEDYLRWKRPTHAYPDKDGKYVLVIPTETPAA